MSELTAALATIEKLRAERDQLAAENVALKGAISAVNRTAEECEVNGDELKYVVEPSEFEALTDLLGETPQPIASMRGLRLMGWMSGFPAEAAVGMAPPKRRLSLPNNSAKELQNERKH